MTTSKGATSRGRTWQRWVARGLVVALAAYVSGPPALADNGGWMPRPETYASEEEARADFLTHYQIGDDATDLFERMRSQGAVVAEANDLKVNPIPHYANIDIFGVNIDISTGNENFDRWRYLFLHREGSIVEWEIQRYFFGNNFENRDVMLSLDDFELSEPGWKQLRDIIIRKIGEPITIETTENFMDTLGFDEYEKRTDNIKQAAPKKTNLTYIKRIKKSHNLMSRLMMGEAFIGFSFLFVDRDFVHAVGSSHEF